METETEEIYLWGFGLDEVGEISFPVEEGESIGVCL